MFFPMNAEVMIHERMTPVKTAWEKMARVKK
jgi:hypothetical protein